MSDLRVVVIGAGIGGLCAALLLAAKGIDVTVIEAAATPGGKMREVTVAGRAMDAGPTVFTMRHVFEDIFDEAGESLAHHITLKPVTTLARHAWSSGRGSPVQQLDLFASRTESADAIARFSSPDEGRRYLGFCDEARAIHDTLEHSFMRRERPTPFSLVREAGIANMLRTQPFSSMWGALSKQFQDPRLRQLFGRYATYCGSSPYLSPATLMLIAHVEQEGVWLVEGGMHSFAKALARLVEAKGGKIRYGEKVSEILVRGDKASGVRLENGEVIKASAVVSNADVSALTTGLFGAEGAKVAKRAPQSSRSLSAVTWNMVARTRGFQLVRHSVFFSNNYKAEFDAIFSQKTLPHEPTVYVCAQDRDDAGLMTTDTVDASGSERLLVLVNAPACGDTHRFGQEEIAQCQQRMLQKLEDCGLIIEQHREPALITTPTEFARMFPATGGALYGRASHGAMASFARPGSRSRIKGLYLTGGSVHPGAGVPMVALSGQIAAHSVMADLISLSQSRPVAIAGGTLMP
jgi:1-hydroxycarotenoid 3,4-desaturase